MGPKQVYKDYYQILGVDRQADDETIRQAYRRLARKYHPDVSKEANAEEQFKTVNEAYEVLGTPSKRQLYDLSKPTPDHVKASTASTAPPKRDRLDSTFFEELSRQEPKPTRNQGLGGLFDSLFNKKSSKHRQTHTPTEPTLTLDLEIEETFQDTIKNITLPHGKTIQIRIPKGATEGKKLRLSGHGANGQDLILTLHIIPHPQYQFQGADIYRDLPISPWEAIFGTTLSLPTPQGTVQLKIPANSQTGRKLRLPGKGLMLEPPNLGDFYITLMIYTPPAQTTAQQQLYQQMQHLFPWNPRA